MATIGFATLDVIPSLRGAQASLERQATGPLAAAGRTAGTKYGDAAGVAAGSRFKSKLLTEAKAVVAPLGAIFAGAAVLSFFKGSFDEAREAATVARQTEAAIKATGGAANVSAAQIDALSQSLSKQVGVDDEAIAGAENLLLTFKGVANQVGEGNDIFDQATLAILNVSTAMKTDLQSSTVQIGKALNDPIKGMTALARAGIQFTQQQKDQAAALVNSGDLIGAQKIILKELAGQFGGAADAGHDAFDDLGVTFKNLEEQAGGALVPALTSLAGVLSDDVIPALSAGGGAAADAFRAFQSLPAPIKTAAEAFIVLRAASALGIGTSIASGIESLKSSMEGLQQRASFARAAFSNARAETFLFGTTSGSASAGVGRLSASMSGLRAATIGLSGALKTVGLAILPIAAITAVVTVWSKFSQSQSEAKARVDELKASLDEQTGALTKSTEASVFDALQKSGAIDDAKRYGIALDDLRDAALGNVDAQARVNAVLDAQQAAVIEAAGAQGRASGATQSALSPINNLRDAIGGQNDEIDLAVQGWKDQAEFMGKGAAASDAATGRMRDYASEIEASRKGLRKLLDLEEERAANAIQQRRDAIGLRESLRSARDELKEDGDKGTLGGTNAASDALLSSLIDVADQFNNSTPQVRGAKGAYEDLRQKFIDLATAMGGGTDSAAAQAKKLADELIKVPKTAPIRFQSEGYKKTLEEIQTLALAAAGIVVSPFLPPTPGVTHSTHGGHSAPAPDDVPRGQRARAGGINIEGDLVVHAQDIHDTKRQLGAIEQQAGLGGRR